MTTPEQERKRLAGVYAGMSDEELAKIATTAFELIDEANQALQAEISRRGLNLSLAPPPGFDVCELNDLVTLHRYLNLPEALLAKGILESAGIQCYLLDENMIRLTFLCNLLGGIKLQVRPADLDAANEILEHPTLETPEVDESF